MHSFLGLVNFLNKYSSKLTELCASLRKLILKDVHYNVQEEHRTAFLEIKEEFCQKIVLPNPKRDLVQFFYSIEFQSILLPDHWLLLSRITRILKGKQWQQCGEWKSFTISYMERNSPCRLTRNHWFLSSRNIWWMSHQGYKGLPLKVCLMTSRQNGFLEK